MISTNQALLSDIDEISRLGNQVDEFQVSDEVVNFWPKNILQNIVKSKTDFLLVAKFDGRIIGFIIVNFNPNFSKAIIENLYVSPQYRGLGVSDLLRDSLIVQLKSVGCKYLCTLIEANSKPAINSYLRYGFNKGIDCVWLDLIIDKSFAK